ncbi:hypothetical protein L1987_48738 [Smallanthus sonchifolius]|uniref:Uncharacterized protein n=1 Tax=Smallanthus sonchifolius TaxID=185202 RepID=A0ACB9FTE2_9ASTR|nr:hypothetical protein L1987_48738 [Smallanthus sonchifolius]
MFQALIKLLKIAAELKILENWEDILGGDSDEELREVEDGDEEDEEEEKKKIKMMTIQRTNLSEASENDDEIDKPPEEYVKHDSDDKIEYETADGKKVKVYFSLGRRKWFRPIDPALAKPKDQKERRQ